MGEFIEPPNVDHKPLVFTNEFISKVVKQSIESGDMPADHKLAFIGIVDERGARAVVSVQIVKKIIDVNELTVKIQGVVEHEWTGDNKAGAQLLFSVK